MSGTSLRQRAYEHVLKKILSGELKPGQQVSEASLAAEIGISRTPVREAINQLGGEGLVTQVPRFGTVVRRPERQDVVELHELREGLESFAVAQAARRIGKEDVEALDASLSEMRSAAEGKGEEGERLRRFLSADMAFHLTLLRAAGNRRVLKIVTESRMLTRLFGSRPAEFGGEVMSKALRFHARILGAVKKGDAEGAREIMAEHIRAGLEESLRRFDRERAGEPPGGLPGPLLEALGRAESAGEPQRR